MNGSHYAQHGSIIDDDVNPRKALHGVSNKSIDTREVSDVTRSPHNVSIVLAAKFIGNGSDSIRVAGNETQISTLPSDGMSQSCTDTPACSSYENSFFPEAIHATFFSRLFTRLSVFTAILSDEIQY
jgi:hypothetical protein